ncbi:MAG: hypothetical protein GF330_13160, partial [Candidatus Eisenbacteria bacterium]|nr:hypothetical protein [Candidatus Eisenbacteria bacterium]
MRARCPSRPRAFESVARSRVVSTLVVLLASLAAHAPQAYELGHTDRIFVDPTRGNRQIPSEIYYPAETAGEDVPLASPPAGGFPVVAFGHGFLIPWEDYDFVWEGLVPAGYFVVLPDTESGLLPDHEDLGLDLAFVISALREAGDNPGSPFYEGVAGTAVACGHSMGGGASFLAAASDPTITALANFAAAETNPSAIDAAASITAPALLFSGSVDCVTPPADHQLPMYDTLASDCRAWANLLGASHCQYAEYNFTCELGEFACDDPTISRSAQHALTLELLTPWLDAVLRDDAAAWQTFLAALEQPDRLDYLLDCDTGGVEEPT